MTWTYSGNPQGSELDQVRFLCGDTDAQDPYLQDEEIQFLLVTQKHPQRAAQLACQSIMAKLAREVDYAIGPEKVTASQRFRQYSQMMRILRASWTNVFAAPSWQGESADRSLFDIGMHDNGGDPYGSSD